MLKGALFRCFIGLSIGLISVSAAIAQTEAEYEAQLKSLSTTIKQLQDELSKVKSSKDALNQTLQASEQEASELTKKIEAIKEALAAEKKQLSQYQTRRADLENTKAEQQEEIQQVVRQAHALGRQSQIKLLLNQEEPSQVSRLLQYHDYIVSAQVDKLESYLETIDELERVARRIANTTERLEAQQNELAERFAALKQTQAKRLATLNLLNRELKNKGGALSELQADRGRLERLLEEATKALASLVLPQRDARPFASIKGQLPLPSKGRIVHRYGSSRLNGALRWEGVFIAHEMGSKVRSVHHGRVIFSDYMRGHGLLLIIDHGGGYMSLYAHNLTLLKETGDWVNTDEPIATMGNTGGQTQAGLYFELRYKGKTINPHRWLARG